VSERISRETVGPKLEVFRQPSGFTVKLHLYTFPRYNLPSAFSVRGAPFIALFDSQDISTHCRQIRDSQRELAQHHAETFAPPLPTP
jgi:hypothetical protein